MPEDGSSDARLRVDRVFIMRVWREAGSEPMHPIRISVAEVGSGQKFYFSDVVDMCDFLQFKLTASADARADDA
jgi:hypothetical protein